MPGVLEEIVRASDLQKPVFLLGAFGGVVGSVCNLLLDEGDQEPLTDEWQFSHNTGYSDMQRFAKANGQDCKYSLVVERLKQLNISELASRCGLTLDEYVRIMRSPFIDECIYLILKGLKALS
jgi:hypothetical protein